MVNKFKLDAQLIPLMHSELVKERSEAGVLYLVAIPVAR